MRTTIPTLLFALLTLSCNVKKEESGEMPEVDVDVETEAGELPEYEVNWADVDVSTRTKMVEVPKVVVVMEEEEVEVPYIDISMDGEDSEERTLMVEAEVTGTEKTIDIKKVMASNNMLYVIATLVDEETDLDGKTVRVQDQVDINAPKSLNVKYFIVGQRPERVFNKRDAYVATMNDLPSEVTEAEEIYTD
ncbi:MAG: hypothetical protein WBG71_11115 [Leeuwenhoekiella sp.]